MPGTDPWSHVDHYLEEMLQTTDPALESALARSAAAGLPSIQVSPTQGKFLHLLARGIRARAVLEIGTLGGYSAIWLGRAIAPEGRLLSLEVAPKHAAIARENLAEAGLHEVVEVRVGPALKTLELLARESAGPFDLVFVDADKPSTPEYFDWSVRLTRPGGLIVVDNVVRRGEVADETSTDPGVRGNRRFLERLRSDPRVSATALQTVGTKGHDGFVLALVTESPGPSGAVRA